MKILLVALLLGSQSFAQAPTAEPPGPGSTKVEVPGGQEMIGTIKKAKVFFVYPKNGATVPRTFTVKMGVEGIKIRPAGEAPDEMTSGHHHLLIDAEPAEAGTPVPADPNHLHLGKGQTEIEITLPPGSHKLTLEFADGAHRAFGKGLSTSINVKVK